MNTRRQMTLVRPSGVGASPRRGGEGFPCARPRICTAHSARFAWCGRASPSRSQTGAVRPRPSVVFPPKLPPGSNAGGSLFETLPIPRANVASVRIRSRAPTRVLLPVPPTPRSTSSIGRSVVALLHYRRSGGSCDEALQRLARLLERWTCAEVKPAGEVTAEIEANKAALERSIEAWRNKGKP